MINQIQSCLFFTSNCTGIWNIKTKRSLNLFISNGFASFLYQPVHNNLLDFQSMKIILVLNGVIPFCYEVFNSEKYRSSIFILNLQIVLSVRNKARK
jgi:hypothetical protein